VWCCKSKRLYIYQLCISRKRCGIGTYITSTRLCEELWEEQNLNQLFRAKDTMIYVCTLQERPFFLKSDLLRMLNTSLCWWRRADTAICIYGQSADTAVPTNGDGMFFPWTGRSFFFLLGFCPPRSFCPMGETAPTPVCLIYARPPRAMFPLI